MSGGGAGPRRVLPRFRRARHLDRRAASKSKFLSTTADSFFMTPLDYILRNMGVDTIIVTGCSTSGCVRATIASGADLGYRVVVPEECVAERSLEAHRYNLFDINARDADLVPPEKVISEIEKMVPPGYHVGRMPRG